MASDIEGIKRALRQWVDAINARRVDFVLDVVADDIVFSQPPAASFTGKAAVEKLYRAAFRTFNVQERLQYRDIRVMGELATVMVRESITLTPKTGGGPIAFTEVDAMRFRRHRNGWKMVSRSLNGPSACLTTFARLAQLTPGQAKPRPA